MSLRSRVRPIAAAALATVLTTAAVGPTVAQDPAPTEIAPPPPTSEAALALEATIPVSILGLELATLSFSGRDIIDGAADDDPVVELEALAATAGASIDDLLLASGTADDGETFVGLLAARLGGLPASEFAPALTPLVLETTEATPFVPFELGGLSGTQVGPGSGLTGDALVYVVEIGPTVWYVVTDRALLEDVLATLPRE